MFSYNLQMYTAYSTDIRMNLIILKHNFNNLNVCFYLFICLLLVYNDCVHQTVKKQFYLYEYDW